MGGKARLKVSGVQSLNITCQSWVCWSNWSGLQVGVVSVIHCRNPCETKKKNAVRHPPTPTWAPAHTHKKTTVSHPSTPTVSHPPTQETKINLQIIMLSYTQLQNCNRSYTTSTWPSTESCTECGGLRVDKIWELLCLPEGVSLRMCESRVRLSTWWESFPDLDPTWPAKSYLGFDGNPDPNNTHYNLDIEYSHRSLFPFIWFCRCTDSCALFRNIPTGALSDDRNPFDNEKAAGPPKPLSLRDSTAACK